MSGAASVHCLLEASDGHVYAGTGDNGDVFKTSGPVCTDEDEDCDGLTDDVDTECWSCTAPVDCDDDDACTIDDCVDHQCQYSAVNCGDSNACTDDSCDSLTGCVNSCNAAGYLDPCCTDPACSGDPICEAAPCSDSDGDGYGDPGDPSCSDGPQTDCNDSNPRIYRTNPNTYCDCAEPYPQGSAEICDDGTDNDCNGLVDGADPSCGGTCVGSAAASTFQADPIHGVSDLGKHLACFMLPVGAIIALTIRRRKK